MGFVGGMVYWLVAGQFARTDRSRHAEIIKPRLGNDTPRAVPSKT